MAIRPLSSILAWVHEQVSAIPREPPSQPFRCSNYTQRLAQDTDARTECLFYVDVESIGADGTSFADSTRAHNAVVVVQVRYLVNDLQAILRSAVDDLVHMADRLQDSRSYAQDQTGICRVAYLGATRTTARKESEIWQARFSIDWRSDEAS